MAIGNYEQSYRELFKDNFLEDAQQMQHRFAPAVTLEPYRADKLYINKYLELSGPRAKVSRLQDTVLEEDEVERRQLPHTYYSKAIGFDNEDELRSITGKSSQAIKAMVAAFNRKKDQIVIDAAVGTAQGFADNTGAAAPSFAFGSNNTVAVDYVDSGSTAASNLTIAKLAKARQLLDASEAPNKDDIVYCFVPSTAKQSLLRQERFISHDYNPGGNGATVAGSFGSVPYLGFEFIHTEQLRSNTNTYDSSTNITDCLVITKGAIAMAVASDLMVRMDERSDKEYAKQLFMKMDMGAVRLYEEGVIKIKVDEDIVESD